MADTRISDERLAAIVEGLGDDTFAGFKRTCNMPVAETRAIITELQALRRTSHEVVREWDGGNPTPEEAAEQLREYARKKRSTPPGDNIFEDAANVIDRLASSPPAGIRKSVSVDDPSTYQRVHDAAIAAYEAATPKDYRYSAVALRRAVDAAFKALPAAIADGGQS
jgi:hypothetical protein